MALLTTIHCSQCKTDQQVMVATGHCEPDICHECDSKNTKKKKDDYLRELTEFSLEERIAKIEEWIYDQDGHRGEVDFRHLPM